jgi:DNA adenine methylase
MKPVIKYQGGKTKELPIIKELLPQGFTRVVEPFCGGAAVSFALGYPSLLNDINADAINLYRVIADPELYPKLQQKINTYCTFDHDALSEIYYPARNLINQSIDKVDPLIRAQAYIVVRQLCFSGMERYNAKGEFNVPFGHYKKMACNLSPDHHNFLRKCDIRKGSFTDLTNYITADDFIFVDPPYLDRLGYTEGDGGELLHTQLADWLKRTSARWMVIHSDHDFYRETYKNFNIRTNDFNYAQRFGKGKNHSGAKVKHLYITNY